MILMMIVKMVVLGMVMVVVMMILMVVVVMTMVMVVVVMMMMLTIKTMMMQVGMILASYICCNLPAMIITMVDPIGQKLPEVIMMIMIMVIAKMIITKLMMLQAHLPILTLLWLSGVVNPIVYVVFNPMYR